MSSTTFRGFCVGVLILFAVSVVMASGLGTYKIKIPFEFYILDKKLPPGEYTFNQPARNVQMVYEAQDAKVRGSLWTSPLPPDLNLRLKQKTWLVFNRYGEEYFLKQVWLASVGSEIRMSKREKELIKQGMTAEEHLIEVKLQ